MDMAIQEAQTELEKIRSDPELVHAYDRYEQTRIDYKFGIQGDRREGRRERDREIAQNLKGSGVSAQQIALWIGLSPDEIAKL
jgi:hypothetical protein